MCNTCLPLKNVDIFVLNLLLNTLEIIGTKEYRQPEWVTHMEEMREALKGMFEYEHLSKMFVVVFIVCYHKIGIPSNT